jgi:hypothetical protein
VLLVEQLLSGLGGRAEAILPRVNFTLITNDRFTAFKTSDKNALTCSSLFSWLRTVSPTFTWKYRSFWPPSGRRKLIKIDTKRFRSGSSVNQVLFRNFLISSH